MGIESDEELETLLIEAIMSGRIRARINGAKRRVYCLGSEQTDDFTFEHWQQLLTVLCRWENTLRMVCFNLHYCADIASMQTWIKLNEFKSVMNNTDAL